MSVNHHFPYLPDRLIRLGDLAYNLWFSWHSEAVWLFQYLDTKLWEDVYRNPVRLLHEIDPQRLDEVSEDTNYTEKYDKTIEAFDRYISNKETWFQQNHSNQSSLLIGYFSMEFGIHECLPIYSGGLGILAGDHLKSASDLGIPMVAVGLLYREAYFTQFISMHGHQQALFLHNDFSNMAVVQVQDKDGESLTIRLELDDHLIAMRIWEARIGRVSLYLLDTDFPENSPENRKITERLYVGDRDLRLLQEILLGIGGVRALRSMKIAPNVWHMNEGHCAFLELERLQQELQTNSSLEEARRQISGTSIFTTHTPITAGNEVFDVARVEYFLKSYWESMEISREDFVRFAQPPEPHDPNAFNMTILAIQFSKFLNGVSELHGQIARRMWHHLWPSQSIDEVPIGSITNGVHVRTWMRSQIKNLFDAFLGDQWRYELSNMDFWKAIYQIPDVSLWKVHQNLKGMLLEEVRERLVQQRERNGESGEATKEVDHVLSADVLTIGFARRFAPYKRATLPFRNIQRLKNILKNDSRPVQIIYAGKAHPANQPGKELILEIYRESRNPEFCNRIVFVENYDIALARRLVSGVDVWMNLPKRPLEASGTSGMKAAVNGVLNLSVLDGWWREGFNGQNGWAVGEDREFYNEMEQDEIDSQSLYQLLENEVVSLYYERDENGFPKRWIEKVKHSMSTIIPKFNTHRMLREYVQKMYLPAVK
jgi:starch phosphorylase